MGKSETAKASIGIKILLSDLISQINDTNFDLIKNMLSEGFIDDENDFFNEVFQDINVGDLTKEEIELEYKEHGTFCIPIFGQSNASSDLSNRFLYNKNLLLPIKHILQSTRYGYDIHGTNGTYIPLDFSFDIEKYKEIQNFEIVFLLEQSSC
jgi:hypothetical protein